MSFLDNPKVKALYSADFKAEILEKKYLNAGGSNDTRDYRATCSLASILIGTGYTLAQVDLIMKGPQCKLNSYRKMDSGQRAKFLAKTEASFMQWLKERGR